MEEYLLKTSLSLSIFYMFFYLFLRNKTFFKANRFYLLFTLFSSFAIYFIPVPTDQKVFTETLLTAEVSDEVMPFHERGSLTSVTKSSVQIRGVILFLYLAGASLLLLRNFFECYRIIALRKDGRLYKIGNARVIRINGDYSFSFFRVLFISNKQAGHAVIQHEKSHIVQWHWIDLVLTEIALAVLWFNPAMWYFKKSMKEQHEYLADDFVLKNGTSLSKYLSTILKSITSSDPETGLINQFNSNPLKNRITMMTNMKTPGVHKLYYFLTIPLLMVLLLSFGRKENIGSPSTDTPITVIIDAAHGGEDAGASSGDITEKELCLSVAQLIKEACTKKGVRAILTRQADESLSLNDRINIAEKENASLMVSIHFAHDTNPKLNGIDCLISKESSSYAQSLRAGTLLVEQLKTVRSVNGVKNSSAAILKGNAVPAVILELGYLSNGSDLSYISDGSNQARIAEHIATSIVNFSK
jgi:N-acetylmuramoyl-L-alanine amidase